MNALILEFVEQDDFAAYLNEQNVKQVRCEIETETGKPHGEFGGAPITVSAVATALAYEGPESTKVIVRWMSVILFTDTLTHRMDKEQTREKLFANFERVRQELAAKGFAVQRGQWKLG